MGSIWRNKGIWKLLGVFVLVTATIGLTMACGYGNGDCGTCQYLTEVTDPTLKQEAEELLKNVVVEERYSYRYDTTRYVLLNNSKVVGVVWETVDLKDLTVGSLFQTNWGVKAELLYNGKVVGQLYLEGGPTGWQNAHGQCNGSCDGRLGNLNG